MAARILMPWRKMWDFLSACSVHGDLQSMLRQAILDLPALIPCEQAVAPVAEMLSTRGDIRVTLLTNTFPPEAVRPYCDYYFYKDEARLGMSPQAQTFQVDWRQRGFGKSEFVHDFIRGLMRIDMSSRAPDLRPRRRGWNLPHHRADRHGEPQRARGIDPAGASASPREPLRAAQAPAGPLAGRLFRSRESGHVRASEQARGRDCGASLQEGQGRRDRDAPPDQQAHGGDPHRAHLHEAQRPYAPGAGRQDHGKPRGRAVFFRAGWREKLRQAPLKRMIATTIASLRKDGMKEACAPGCDAHGLPGGLCGEVAPNA